MQFFRRNNRQNTQTDRIVYANKAEANDQFVDNVVITSKYTWWNFIPLFLFEQFTRAANFYFLCVTILQAIGPISITGSVPTNALPLSVVICFDGIVTIREDYKRHKDDDKANNTKILVLRNGKFEAIPWAKVRVGDILKIQRNEAVPSDCVFLASHCHDTDSTDSCYVQTAQLDGETNLKLKQAVIETATSFRTDEDCASYRGYAVCEAPNAAFDKFVGMLYTDRSYGPGALSESRSRSPTVTSSTNYSSISTDQVHPSSSFEPSSSSSSTTVSSVRPIPLEADQLLLRGSILRNVDYVYAMVVYTGKETKVRVRQTTRPMKRAQVEQVLNKIIVVLVLILIAFCFIGAIGSVLWARHFERQGSYLTNPDNYDPRRSMFNGRAAAQRGVQDFFTYFLLNAGFIPVSLYVSVRLARSFQMIVMEWDVEMFHEDPDLYRASGGLEGQYPFKVRSMDLNDELGQISHVFSDKTGTLTLNYMEFRKFLVNGISYGLGTTQIGIDRLRREGHDVQNLLLALDAAKQRKDKASTIPHVNFEDGSETHPGSTLGHHSQNPSDQNQGTAIYNFFLHLTLNHSVLRETVRDSNDNIVGSRLSASSPDEEAFLCAGEHFGYTFITRMNDIIVLHVRYPVNQVPIERLTAPLSIDERNQSDAYIQRAHTTVLSKDSVDITTTGTLLPFRILHTLPYTQERKRMSVIVQFPVIDTDGKPVLARVGGPGHTVLYCKGADNVIMDRLTDYFIDSHDHTKRRRTRRILAEWGNDGLRTLCFAYRNLDASLLQDWSKRFVSACTNMQEVRKKKDKMPNLIDNLMDQIERHCVLQGATANEDKLQPEVPETIAKLAKAGIKTWMVTGDKQETAVNIGFATRLLDDTMRQVVATVESANGVTTALKRIRIAAKRMRAERNMDKQMKAVTLPPNGAANVITWMQQKLGSIENSIRVLSEGHPAAHNHTGDSHTDIDIDATALRMEEAEANSTGRTRSTSILVRMMSRSGTTGRGGLKLASPASSAVAPRNRGSSYFIDHDPLNNSAVDGDKDKTHVSGDVSPTASLTESSARSRAVSYASDEGENDIAHAEPHIADLAIGHQVIHVRGKGDDHSDDHTSDLPFSSSVATNPLRESSSVDRTQYVPEPSIHPWKSPANPPSLNEDQALSLASSLLTLPPLLGPQRRPYALIIDEPVLDAALSHPRTKAYLLYVSVNCAAVIVCRARPDQKAQVVRLIRHGVNHSRTLAIGDGANDVDMISNAHVGVGISGAEGVQAANASDYAIGRFRFLQRLLLVHGRWNYSRMTRLVLYMFWKNIVFVLSQFAFQFRNGFSGQKWYLEYGTQTYNLLYTGLPVLLMAVLDRDMDAEWALKYPKLYDFGRLSKGLNLRIFAAWVLDAVVMTIINVVITLYSFGTPSGPGPNPFNTGMDGSTPYIFMMGTVAFTNVIIIVTMRMAMETNSHHWLYQIVLAGSALLWVPACYIIDALKQDNIHGGINLLFRSPTFWFILLLVGATTSLYMVFTKAWSRFYYPTLSDIVQEVAVVTHDTTSIDDYVDACDLARRTGKSLKEVLEARKIAAIAAAALAPVLDAADSLGIPSEKVTAFHQRSVGVSSKGLSSLPVQTNSVTTNDTHRSYDNSVPSSDVEAYLSRTPVRPVTTASRVSSHSTSDDYQALASSAGTGMSIGNDSFVHTHQRTVSSGFPTYSVPSSSNNADHTGIPILSSSTVTAPYTGTMNTSNNRETINNYLHTIESGPSSLTTTPHRSAVGTHDNDYERLNQTQRRILEGALLPPKRQYSLTTGKVVLDDDDNFDNDDEEENNTNNENPQSTAYIRKYETVDSSVGTTYRYRTGTDVALPAEFIVRPEIRDAHISRLRELSNILQQSILRSQQQFSSSHGGSTTTTVRSPPLSSRKNTKISTATKSGTVISMNRTDGTAINNAVPPVSSDEVLRQSLALRLPPQMTTKNTGTISTSSPQKSPRKSLPKVSPSGPLSPNSVVRNSMRRSSLEIEHRRPFTSSGTSNSSGTATVTMMNTSTTTGTDILIPTIYSLPPTVGNTKAWEAEDREMVRKSVQEALSSSSSTFLTSPKK